MKIETALINILAVLESLPEEVLQTALEQIDLSDEAWDESFSALEEYLNNLMYSNLTK